MVLAAFVSFISFMLVIHHIPKHIMRRIVGYKGWFDVLLHGTILYMFMGTSTMGLLQAEGAGICFSLYLRFYSWAFGYEKLIDWSWQRFAGKYT